MSSLKTIRRRLTSVTSTRKILKAMNMVAASNMQRNKTRLDAAQVYYAEAESILNDYKKRNDIMDSLFIKPAIVNKSAYLLITGNKGLCGGYNNNVSQKALDHMQAKQNEQILLVGSKGYDYLKRRGRDILHKFNTVPEAATHEDAEQISSYLSLLYTSGLVDSVYVAYTQFESILTHVPSVVKVLPIGFEAETKAVQGNGVLLSQPEGSFSDDNDMLYDIDVSLCFDYTVLLYLSAFIYAAMLESSACEQAARMMNMDTAVNNASDIIDRLTRQLNRRRQSAITEEIIEIVSNTASKK